MKNAESSYSVFPPPFQKGGGNPNFENFKKGGNLKKKFGVGERFSKIKGGNPTF